MLLLLTRISCFVYTAPFFSTPNTPRRLRVGFSVLMTVLIYNYVLPYQGLSYETIWEYAALVIMEAACGLLIGFVGNICISVIQFAGAVMDMDIGLSMVNMFDPVSRQQTGFTGTLYRYAILLLLIGTDMHHYILSAFVDAYRLIPVGGVNFQMARLFEIMVGFMGDAFVIAFRIYLPIYATMLLLNSILGILAKVAPQMNMFAVGIQLKIFTGFTALILTVGLLPQLSDFIFSEMKQMITAVVEAMS